MRARSKLMALAALLSFAAIAYAATQWVLQQQRSELTFSAVQAGAPFEGRFERFTADIRFDSKDLASSRFEIRIDLASVDTQDGERDDILKGPDLFAVKQWPTATYIAERFEHRSGAKFVAAGRLTLRGVTRPVPIEFTFDTSGTGAVLKGSATVKRLDFGVGQGEWEATGADGIANEVQVRYTLSLTRG